MIVSYPNPLDLRKYTAASIKWELSSRTPVRLDVYNLLGQHVINLYRHNLQEPEPGSVAWKGVDSEGRKVASGVYLIRLQTRRETTFTRLTLQR